MNTRRGAACRERGAGRSGLKSAVERDLPRSDPEPVSSATVPGSSVFSPGLPICDGRRQDQPARAALGVLGHLRDLRDVPELVRLAELALADRPCVRVGERHDPVLDRLPRDPQLDLPGDLLAAVGELLQRAAALSFARRATPTRLAPGGRASVRASLIERSKQLPGLLGQREHLRLRLPSATTDRARHLPQLADPSPSSDPVPALASRRSASRACAPPWRAHLTPCEANPASVGYLTSASTTVESIRHRPRPEPLLAGRGHDQRARQLRHRLGPDPPRQLAHRRLVRHPLRQAIRQNRRR